MLEINAETPVDNILDAQGVNQRALMTRLACLVFGKAEGHILRAYTQFSPKALAALIEARRKGVFDYGETIRKLGVGAWVFPNQPTAVLEALDLANQEKYDEVNLEALQLVDEAGAPIIDLTRLFPTMKTGRKPQTKKEEPKGPTEAELAELAKEKEAQAAREAAEAEAKAKAEAEAAAEAKRRQEAQEAQKAKRVKAEQEEVSETSAPDPVSAIARIVEPIQDHIARLSTNLGETLEGMHKQTTSEIQAVVDEMNQTSAQLDVRLNVIEQNQIALAKALRTFDRNVQQILMYFVDPHMEFEQLPLGGFRLSESAAETSPSAAETSPAPEPQEEEPGYEPDDKGSSIPETNEHAEEPDEDATVKRYTEEELKNMELQDLRDYAASIGCTPARWMKTNVNRILKEYERQDAEG